MERETKRNACGAMQRNFSKVVCSDDGCKDKVEKRAIACMQREGSRREDLGVKT